MNLVAVVPAAGGVGATTLAAHLAVSLARKRRLGAAVDLCPGNALRLHLGMDWQDAAGLAAQVAAGRPWSDGAYVSSGGVPFLPFGRTGREDGGTHLAAWLEAQPGGLGGCLEQIRLPSGGILLADAPRLPWQLTRQALARADLTILVAAPDAASYAGLPALLEGVADAGCTEVRVVINGFDPCRDLDRDMALLLANDPGLDLAPVMVHRDEAVREALACKQTVFDYAPSCQAAHDFEALATWVVARLGHRSRQAA
ncbi:MAG: cellulose biosynthesis protein BcsQ [Candidatus Bathyarchaeota archaeon]